MTSIHNEKNAGIVLEIIQAIHENTAYLSEIDGSTGDGDHGINMNKGFLMAKERIAQEMSLSEAFRILGRTLILDIGGSMGPIYGTMFSAFGRELQREPIEASTLLSALSTASQELMELAGARVGDKTLIDTLCPATQAYENTLAKGGTFADALQALADGAEAGKESTKNLVAKIGRAARLGERSKGFLDAGATSCCIILQVMATVMRQQLAAEN